MSQSAKKPSNSRPESRARKGSTSLDEKGRRSYSANSSETQVQCQLCGRWLQAITYTHLKYKHAIEDPQEYKDEFSLYWITASEVRGRIADLKTLIKGRDLEYLRRTWGKQRQKKIAADLNVNVQTVQRTAKAAMLPPLVEFWDLAKIRTRILQARRKKVPLYSGAARRLLPRLYRRARYHYGSWKKALQAAGIRYTDVARRGPFEKWSRDRILTELRALVAKGKHLDYLYVDRRHRKLYTAARNYFGNWRKAVRAALKRD